MPATPHTPHGEDGFTLIELLVSITISIIVLLAAFMALDVFTSNAAQQSRQNDANDQVRAAMDQAVGDLRGASAVLRATATDLVYYVPETTTTNRIERLCVSTGNVLFTSSTVTSGTPAAPAGLCGAAGHNVGTRLTTANTAFTYDGATSSATPGLVKNVGLAFSLSSSGGGKTGSSVLKASAARRSSGTLPITDGDLNSGCNGAGALLSLSANIPNVAALSVTYSTTAGVTLAVTTGTNVANITLPSTTTTIVATVTDALGVTNTIQKDVTCTS